ncbi:MAG: hypothetical protein RXO23_03080 [Vulcanisaeta sp.]
MDAVKALAIATAMVIVATYVVVNNVPGNAWAYINQPMEIIDKVEEEAMHSVFMPSMGTETEGLTKAMHLINAFTAGFTIELPSVQGLINGGLSLSVIRPAVGGGLTIKPIAYGDNEVVLSITNYLSYPVVVVNITGDYIIMTKELVVRPNETLNATLLIVNPEGFYEALARNNVHLCAYLEVNGLSITAPISLGREGGTSIAIPMNATGEVDVNVRNYFPFNVTIMNITAPGVNLVKPIIVPPNGEAVALIKVENPSSLSNLSLINATIGLGGLVINGEFRLSANGSLSLMNANKCLVTIPIHNPLDTAVTVYEVKGPYLELTRPQALPPGTAELTLRVDDLGRLLRSIEAGNEDVVVVLGVDGFNVTKELVLGRESTGGFTVISFVINNPTNTSLTILNITAPGIYLANAVTLPPMGNGVANLVITGIPNLVNQLVNISLEVVGVKLTETFRVTSNMDLEPVVIEVPIKNPLNVTLTVLNITNGYLYLTRQVEVAPGGVGILELRVINATEAFSTYAVVVAKVGSTVVRLRVRP